MKYAVLAAAAAVSLTASSYAATVVDTTATSATNDGTINSGEYVGGVDGINGGFGDVIGDGARLNIDSSVTGDLNFGLQVGPGTFGGGSDTAVIYIDSIAGGFASTADDGSSFGTQSEQAVSPDRGSQITFASGFLADYAISMESGFAGLYQLTAGGPVFVTSANQMVMGKDREFEITLGQLGLAAGDSFDFFATYGNPFDADGFFRSNEFIGASFSGGNPGLSNVTLTDFSTFVTVVPEPVATLGGSAMLGLLALRRRK